MQQQQKWFDKEYQDGKQKLDKLQRLIREDRIAAEIYNSKAENEKLIEKKYA